MPQRPAPNWSMPGQTLSPETPVDEETGQVIDPSLTDFSDTDVPPIPGELDGDETPPGEGTDDGVPPVPETEEDPGDGTEPESTPEVTPEGDQTPEPTTDEDSPSGDSDDATVGEPADPGDGDQEVPE